MIDINCGNNSGVLYNMWENKTGIQAGKWSDILGGVTVSTVYLFFSFFNSIHLYTSYIPVQKQATFRNM